MKSSLLLPALLLATAWLTGCGKSNAPESPPAAKKPADFVQTEEVTPEQRTYLEFGREVMLALAARDYERFHGQLSSHAVARMSLNQFDPADDDAVFERNERSPRRKVDAGGLALLMALVENRHGAPAKPLDLHLHSAEPHILAGQAKEQMDAIDILFAIGNMPKDIPASIRRASLRGKMGVTLSPEQLAAAAKDYGMSVEELQKQEDFQPYITVKLVVVEENGALRVGYFEFLPPSIMD